jgi:hypothetical protein
MRELVYSRHWFLPEGRRLALVFFLLFSFSLEAEPLRIKNAGNLLVSLNNPEGASINLSYIDSAVLVLDQEIRFFRGIELEFTAPQTYLAHRGSLALAIYADLSRVPDQGVADIEGRQISFEPIPNKIQTIYQIPIRQNHGLRTTPYASTPTGVIDPASFPIIFRVLPVIKGLSEEIETMRFQLSVKPLLSDEGAVKVSPRYPEQLPGRPFTLLIDDEVVERPQEERLLKEGEHHLVILSNDYRNESRSFMIERGKILDLSIILQDPTPLVIFEGPENARIFFDNEPIEDTQRPYPVEPGAHEVRFQLSDDSVIRTLNVHKGKTYRVALAVDVDVSEND